ncbi:MAG: TrbI/VirB10 family protein [Vicinamibacterales bacterium]
MTDRRPVPRGVLPRRVQTWLMAALAIGMLLIIVLTGGQSASKPGAQLPAVAPHAPDPDRVREYQDRLRALDAQVAQEARGASADKPPAPAFDNGAQPSAQTDPVVADRRRREYESLFATNVVLSRRPEAERPDPGGSSGPGHAGPAPRTPAEPSVDDIADAVVRATVRSTGGAPVAAPPSRALADAPSGAAPHPQEQAPPPPRVKPVGQIHRVPEGTLIDAVLTNRLDGSVAAPVDCLVTNPVYSRSGQHVLVPAGAHVLGETKPVQALGETRLAVVFHRLLLPDGSSVVLDQFRALNQSGDSGLRDRVNQHYWSTFGAAGAVGLVSGLTQLLGNATFGGGDGNRTVVVAGSGADATAQASSQKMNRFLNQLPTVTIREGHRVKVYVTSDLDLPAWAPQGSAGQPERR